MCLVNESLYFNYFRRMYELQYECVIPGVPVGKKIQFAYRKIDQWIIPQQLTKCYWDECGKSNM